MGKVLGAFGALAMVLTWIANVSGQPVMGMTAEHLFNNVVGLPLLALVSLFIGYLYSKKL